VGGCSTHGGKGEGPAITKHTKDCRLWEESSQPTDLKKLRWESFVKLVLVIIKYF
jgi:hypothetical protein